MAKIINLRTARKARKRAEARAEGRANAARFGAPKAERDRLSQERALSDRRHESHRRDDEDGGDATDG